MPVLIIGSGLAGAVLGARLLAGRKDVTFLVSPRRQRQLLTRGLHVRSRWGTFRRPVAAITPPELTNVYSMVFVCVRACEYEQALSLATPTIGAGTIVVPIVEGVKQLDLLPRDDTPNLVVGVFEARGHIDGDGITTLGMPAAELSLGALRAHDQSAVEVIAEMFIGSRGLKVTQCSRIRARTYERFNFQAAAVATSVLLDRPLRDARFIATGTSTYENALAQGAAIGKLAGYEPDDVRVRAYRTGHLMEGRPIQPPALIEPDGGRGSDEAAFLLGEMTALGRSVGRTLTNFESAWRRLMGKGGFSRVAMPELGEPS